ncbi:hypothetical protein FB567DRAFT_261000 [Paraphoma chrysanthemicola]|uniref:C2H2-type domain-containing protein n=1 Tax=Paraphoma chrysanthemicola TaxID=798071 RepID=A0A8K0QRK7_9PLEO|nr:hypothetical protein FB567DRAFT_261000 [Paraphoma chrysanthemicola]
MSKRRFRAKKAQIRNNDEPKAYFTPEAKQSSISSAIQCIRHKGSFRSISAFEDHIRGQLGSSQDYSYPQFTDASSIEVESFIVTGIFERLRDVVEIMDEEEEPMPTSTKFTPLPPVTLPLDAASKPLATMDSKIDRLDAHLKAGSNSNEDSTTQWKWNICNANYAQRKLLRRHIALANCSRGDRPNIRHPKPQRTANGAYVCPYPECGSMFNKESADRSHMSKKRRGR